MSIHTFTCQCHTHQLQVEYDPELGVEFAFWQYGDGWHPWSYRLRHIWRIIRHGEPYSDYVSLSHEDAARLAVWLSAIQGAATVGSATSSSSGITSTVTFV